MSHISITPETSNSEKLLSLAEFCKELSISTATGRNWIRLGKLVPEYTEKKAPYFAKSYVTILKDEIRSGKNKTLKSRRNKKYVSGNAFYHSYVSEECKNIFILQKMLSIVEAEKIPLNLEVIQYIVADCALHLLAGKLQLNRPKQTPLLSSYLNRTLEIPDYSALIDALICDKEAALAFCHDHPILFSFDYTYEPGEDILGLIYISCKSMGNRKLTGSYYTPTTVVKKLISSLDIDPNHKILDPCCGTGNFLLQLPEKARFENIYGNDIDAVSVKITRLNMALKYLEADVETIYRHITTQNYLTEYPLKGFDHIIGNPPWGYEFSDAAKNDLRKKYKTAAGKNIESYDVFMERAMSHLVEGGQLSFVLPEAILNVKTHTRIRSLILQTSSIKYLEYLGNAFDHVQCPCIILQIVHTGRPLSTKGMSVDTGMQAFQITTDRPVSSKCFSFFTTDAEYRILEKLRNTENATSLKGNADFALGIVTGNNQEYISTQKTAENEMILKGSDICKYHINQAKNYIMFKPEHFQQTAPTEMYRAPEKLLYRFICSQLVFAYDDRQTLSLNSCNVIIPRLPDTKIKYILALLNSSVAQFIYQKEFHSVKVLRSHIESIPIPMVDLETQDRIISVTDLLIQGQTLERAAALYDELDNIIFALFRLTDDERDIIRLAVGGENKFFC